MKEQFEKLPEVAEIFKGLHPTIIWFCDKSNKYATSFSGFDDRVMWLNGALYAYQEQQKIIDEMKAEKAEHIERMNKLLGVVK